MSETALAVVQQTTPTTRTDPAAIYAPASFEQAYKLAEMLARSSFVPKQFAGRPGDVFAAMAYGAEVGLGPLQALQSVAIINGKPALWGDGLLAVCQRHPAWGGCEEHEPTEDAMYGECTVYRKGEKPHTKTFSQQDAVAAGLWKKAGPWSQYPKRMLQLRARGLALRDKFSDALKGMKPAEEVLDYIDAGPLQEARTEPMPQLPAPSATNYDPQRAYRILAVIAKCDDIAQLKAIYTHERAAGCPQDVLTACEKRAAQLKGEPVSEMPSEPAETTIAFGFKAQSNGGHPEPHAPAAPEPEPEPEPHGDPIEPDLPVY